MSINISQVAQLARLELPAVDQAEFQLEIDTILDFVAQLDDADLDSVTPMLHPLDGQQRLRLDHVTETNQREALLALTQHSEDGYYLVPQVIE